MCTQSSRSIKKVELADIFSQHAEAYIASHGVSSIQHKAINAIYRCRTAALGGHVLRCNHCGVLEVAYNSCRYRHCPKCQTTKKLRWLEERKAELLPVPYFHVVFTLPHELNQLTSYNQAAIYNLLFKAAWATVNTLGHDKKLLGAQTGMVAFLHTWNQKLNQHNHLHCMVPAGGLDEVDGQFLWRALKKLDYLFPVKVMGKLFGKIFLTELTRAFKNNEFQFRGCIAELAKESNFMKLKLQLSKKTWNVYAKEPFNGAEGGMEYLARYFAKTAIGNERILSCDENQVAFKWRDSKDNKKTKVMHLDAHEFIRRYLSHILPHGFMRARYFGFLASSVKAKNITLINSLLSTDKQEVSVSSSVQTIPARISEPQPSVSQASHMINDSHIDVVDDCKPSHQFNLNNVTFAQDIKTFKLPDSEPESIAELMKRVVGIDIALCKHCKFGRLEKIQMFLPSALQIPTAWDTS
ncbi:MAG: IS91 family transposase [bacterium]|nr:IS91 family transposase [bacterium]